MRTSTVFVLALGLACGTTAALAADQDSVISCATAGREVSAALANTDNEAARQEKKMGLEFCTAGFYHKGMLHYGKALELLGVKS